MGAPVQLHRFGAGDEDRVSAPAQFVQSLIVDAQVMCDFVKHRSSDFSSKGISFEAELQVSFTENCNSIRHDSEVVDAAVGERHSFVESEQAVSGRILVGGGPILHYDDEVVDTFGNPVWELVESLVNKSLEVGTFHPQYSSR